MGEPLDLEPIRAREQAATPGPWQRYVYLGGSSRIYINEPKRTLIADTGGEADRVATTYQYGDADFLFHARADVPALLAEVERLRALVVAHHFYGKALPLGQLCPVCVEHGCAHSEHDLDAVLRGDR